MRYLMVILCLLMVTSIAIAEETNTEPLAIQELKLPDMQAGMVYSVETSEFNPCFTATLLRYPTKIGDFELRGGYITDKISMAAIAFKVGDLTQFGFEMPLHHLINVSFGPYAGYAIDTKEFDYGIMCTVIQLKF